MSKPSRIDRLPVIVAGAYQTVVVLMRNPVCRKIDTCCIDRDDSGGRRCRNQSTGSLGRLGRNPSLYVFGSGVDTIHTKAAVHLWNYRNCRRRL